MRFELTCLPLSDGQVRCGFRVSFRLGQTEETSEFWPLQLLFSGKKWVGGLEEWVRPAWCFVSEIRQFFDEKHLGMVRFYHEWFRHSKCSDEKLNFGKGEGDINDGLDFFYGMFCGQLFSWQLFWRC